MGALRSGDVVRVRAHGMRWLAVADFADALPRLDIDRSRHPEHLSKAEFVKDNTVRTVMRAQSPAAPGAPLLYVKRFKLKSLGRKLRALAMPTRAAHEWRIGRALQRDGIPTCRVLATASRRSGPFCQEAFLISEEIPGAIPLSEYLRSTDLALDFKKQLIGELAALVVRMLEAGYYHRDLHAGNVLIAPHRPAGERHSIIG